MKTALWFGIYDARGNLVDCTPGEFFAKEQLAEFNKAKKGHVIAPVMVIPVDEVHEPEQRVEISIEVEVPDAPL